MNEVDPGLARLSVILSVVFAVAFGGAGTVIARRRGSSPLLGALMGLMCGPLGLYVASRLPGRDGSRMRRTGPISFDPDLDGPRMIDPEVARKLGLPPQRPFDPTSPLPPSPGSPPPYPPPPPYAPPPPPPPSPPPWKPGAN